MKRIWNGLLGTLVLANVVVFAMFVGVEPIGARAREECDTECCFCMGPGGGQEEICAVLQIACELQECENDDACNP